MNIAAVKEIDLVAYLASLSHHPSKVKNNDYWYRSPLRDEKTASFKINRKQNVWYDHGTGKGGGFIEFGMQFHHCSLTELLEKLNGNFSFHQQPVIASVPKEPVIKIIAENNLNSISLLRYLRQRRIEESIAKKYCREVIFSLREKRYAAIGFKNNEGGFELRNPWFKGSSSPKAITSFENHSSQLAVFEGFFDFLSHATINQNQSASNNNILVLNSTAYFEKSREFMEQHNSIHLFLDRDTGGERCTAKALSWNKKYTDESRLYDGYNDLNDWMQQIGKSQQKSLKQKRNYP